MTAPPPPSSRCCDEHGWALDIGGQPVEPAVKCNCRAGTPQPTKQHGNHATTDSADTRDGNKHKFAWFYEMLADPTVSLAAKVVGGGCCMKLAGRKGHFKATRKAIAKLCGISQSTVRRGLADLIDKGFLTADIHEGAASTYYLILPAQRWEKWLTAEKEHHDEMERAEAQMRSWLWAENLHKANQFRDAVCEASMARGADQRRALEIGNRLAAQFRDRDRELSTDEGLAWVDAQQPEVFLPDPQRADPGPPESRPRYAREPGSVRLRADPGPPESRPRLTPDALTSGNGQTHNLLKDSERPVKVFQDLESDPALRNALNARPPRGSAQGPADRHAGTCALCDSDGIFLDSDNYPVVLIDDDCTEYPVQCRHSMAANLADIQRREKAEELGLCRTGWPEIDAHYPRFTE